MKITIDRGDGTSFVGVSEGTITQEGTGTNAFVICPALGWAMVAGNAAQAKTGTVAATTAGSKVLLQTFPSTPTNRNTMTRVLLVEASGGGTVAALDNSDQAPLSAGQYIDVINSNPVQIGTPQTYVASSLPETATALSDAEAALEAED